MSFAGNTGYPFTPDESQAHSTPKLLFAVINDSNVGSIERGEKGLYLGPDDFLTFSFLLRLHSENWRAAITHNHLTSRKYQYRYDLIFAGLSRSFCIKRFEIEPELGLVWKGDSGGEILQNWFHRLRGLPELFIPYSTGGLGVFISTITSWQTETSFPQSGIITAATEIRILSDFVPSRVSPMLGYQTAFLGDRLQFELLGGARFYLNELDEYSELVRSGMFLGMNLKTRVYDQLYFDLGLSLFPVQNLETDPAYADKGHDYIPQITLVFSWNSAWYRLYNFLEY